MTPTADVRWREAALVLLVAACYVVLGLRQLGILPPVYEDEPWQASSAFELARAGVFGSNLVAGLNGMERSTFLYPPVHPLLLAATFRVAGVGLYQARLEAVGMGLLALLATWWLGRRLGGPTVGCLAAVLLLVTRTSYQGRYQPTGILFLDATRVARYDAVVPFFALLAILVASSAAERRRSSYWAVAGAVAGIAALTHLYALFLLPPLVAFAIWERAGRRELAALAAGFLLPWTLCAGYAATDLDAWLAQTRGYAPRFRLFDAAWYLDNLARERWRYTQGLGAPGWSWLLRPGLWSATLGVPLALAGLLSRAARADAGTPVPGARVPERHAARLLALPLLTLPPLYALLLWLKLPSYRLMIQPFCALALAWGIVRLLRARRDTAARRRTIGALALLGLLVVAEAAAQVVARERRARETTPYAELAARLRGAMPPAGRILGMHHYWFGFEDRDYRSWAVPLLAATDPQGAVSPARLVARLDALAPRIVLVDPRLREAFDQRPELARVVRAWLDERSFEIVARIDDRTYGRIEIFVRSREPER